MAIKKDCFAYDKEKKGCFALHEMICEIKDKCPFYKPESNILNQESIEYAIKKYISKC